MQWKAKNAPELISEHAFFQKISLGEHALGPPSLPCAYHTDKPSPLKSSLFTYFPSPTLDFLNATLHGVWYLYMYVG